MDIPLFDAFSGFGGATPGQTAVVSAEECRAEMARLSIGGALVRRVPEELETDAEVSNDHLYAACAPYPDLLPCPIVLPSPRGDGPSEPEQVAAHLGRGCGAAWIRPEADCWSLAPWCSDPLFAALAARRLPLLVLATVGFERVGEVAARHPALPLLLAGVGYAQQRLLLPLLREFPNVHLLLGGAYAVPGGLEHLVAEVGPTRLLFGTGFPKTEPAAAVTYLMYAALGVEEKRLIGAGNLERLLAEVVR